MKRKGFLWLLAIVPAALFSMRGFKLCPACGKPDREVFIGFLMCRSCFDRETRDLKRKMLWGHGPEDGDDQEFYGVSVMEIMNDRG